MSGTLTDARRYRGDMDVMRVINYEVEALQEAKIRGLFVLLDLGHWFAQRAGATDSPEVAARNFERAQQIVQEAKALYPSLRPPI
jgi:hypothetical protein